MATTGEALPLAPIPAAPFRRLLSIITLRPLVALIDGDGKINMRLAWRDGAGRWSATRVGFGIRRVLLLDGGQVGNGCYVHHWWLVRGRMERSK